MPFHVENQHRYNNLFGSVVRRTSLGQILTLSDHPLWGIFQMMSSKLDFMLHFVLELLFSMHCFTGVSGYQRSPFFFCLRCLWLSEKLFFLLLQYNTWTILDPKQLKTVGVGLNFHSFVGPTVFGSQQMKIVGVKVFWSQIVGPTKGGSTGKQRKLMNESWE